MSEARVIELERRTDQVASDLREIYSMLGHIDGRLDKIRGIQMQQGNRLDDMEARLQGVEITQGEHTQKLDEIIRLLKR